MPELVHPEDKQIVIQAVAEALRGGPRYDVEYRVVRPNGEVRLVHSQGDVMWDESGRPRRMFGTVQDITERKRAEQRLVAQHTVTQILAEAATLEEATTKILQSRVRVPGMGPGGAMEPRSRGGRTTLRRGLA